MLYLKFVSEWILAEDKIVALSSDSDVRYVKVGLFRLVQGVLSMSCFTGSREGWVFFVYCLPVWILSGRETEPAMARDSDTLQSGDIQIGLMET